MVFAKSKCPFCIRTKTLLSTLQKTIAFGVHYVDLDLLPQGDGHTIQNYLLQITGQRTVPNIFIGKCYYEPMVLKRSSACHDICSAHIFW